MTKRVVIDMDDKRRALYKKVANDIMRVLRQLDTPAEGHAVLSLVLHSMEQTYGIEASYMLESGTETTQ